MERVYELTESQIALLTKFRLTAHEDVYQLCNEKGGVIVAAQSLEALFEAYETSVAKKALERLKTRPRVKLTRPEAEELVERLMTDKGPEIRGTKNAWHFGKCEVQVLLDHVYGFDSDGMEVPL